MTNTIKRILVPVDFSSESRAALWRATELAAALGASVDVLHVLDLPEARHMATEFYVPLPPEYREELHRGAQKHLDEWLSTANVPAAVHRDLAEGKPSAEIVDYARNHADDMIVIGTHGRGGVSHLLLGSVAEKVVRSAPCPVLTVRAASAAGA